MISRRFIAFVVAGGTAACANFGSRILFSELMPYVPAIVLAYLVGMATAFALNRLFVFTEAQNELKSQVFWFAVVNLAAIAQTVAISLIFARWLFPATGMDFHPEAVAHGIGVIVPVFTSYLGHKRFTFRSRH
ncbi:GtrA family protein [Lysobacter sp. CA199]|uniref:GtrA family protein n=1 Tax=Lysobacter sp. CA199 TaxID=3455608 RepID=UPI003F8D3ADA